MPLFTVVLFAASATAVEPARDTPVFNPAPQASFCPETPMSLARKMGKRPPQATPLSKLPPAQTFMAVDRRIAGCPAPLTMIEYRRGVQGK
jgi:hypothetical protein